MVLKLKLLSSTYITLCSRSKTHRWNAVIISSNPVLASYVLQIVARPCLDVLCACLNTISTQVVVDSKANLTSPLPLYLANFLSYVDHRFYQQGKDKVPYVFGCCTVRCSNGLYGLSSLCVAMLNDDWNPGLLVKSTLKTLGELQRRILRKR